MYWPENNIGTWQHRSGTFLGGRKGGYVNGLILQTNAAHHTKMKQCTRFNKDASAAWYSYNYKFFGRTTESMKFSFQRRTNELVTLIRPIEILYIECGPPPPAYM
jgi:hypothetical protein